MSERTEASVRRKALHRAIANGDLEAMREAIHGLYVDEASPLLKGEVRRIETYAPIVEAAIVARIYAPGTLVSREMDLNLLHTHAKFGVPTQDYEAIVAQLDQLDETDASTIDWCVGTCLHERVKPFRHKNLFNGPPTDHA